MVTNSRRSPTGIWALMGNPLHFRPATGTFDSSESASKPVSARQYSRVYVCEDASNTQTTVAEITGHLTMRRLSTESPAVTSLRALLDLQIFGADFFVCGDICSSSTAPSALARASAKRNANSESACDTLDSRFGMKYWLSNNRNLAGNNQNVSLSPFQLQFAF